MTGDVVEEGEQRRPRVEVFVVALAAATLATWGAALLQSMPPPVPTLVVQGEALVPPGAPVAIRVTAARPNATTRSRVAGVLSSGTERAAIVDGTARLSRLEGPVIADLVIDDEVQLRASLAVQEATAAPVPPVFTFSPWHAEVQTAVTPPRDGAASGGGRAPVYPVDGRVSARLPSRVILFGDDGPMVAVVEPRVQGALLADGRVLAVDRSGIQLRVPLEIGAPGEVEVQVVSAEPRDVSLDLLVGGVIHDVASVRVPAGGSATKVRLRLGPARPGDVVVVHAGGPWPDDLGPWAVARIADPSQPLEAWVTALAAKVSPAAHDAIRGLIPHQIEVDGDESLHDDVLRALLARLEPARLRAARLQVTPEVTSALGEILRLAYIALSIALVVAVLGLGFARLPGKRGAVLLSGLVVALLLGGLLATLFVVSSGSP